jgi:hypothetical protein
MTNAFLSGAEKEFRNADTAIARPVETSKERGITVSCNRSEKPFLLTTAFFRSNLPSKMKYFSVAFALLAPVHAGLRFPCSTLTFQRLDPVVEPGSSPSSHVHHIVGGNAFNASMTGDVASRASCTTCQMADDFSNYWTATLYFKHPTNGSYHRVPVIPVQPLLGGSDGAQGGLTVYYTQFDLSRDNLKSQPPINTFPPVCPKTLTMSSQILIINRVSG